MKHPPVESKVHLYNKLNILYPEIKCDYVKYGMKIAH
jgi:hypothetical protein